MRVWAYFTPGDQLVLLRAPNRGAALRQINLLLKQGVGGEDRAFVEVPKMWFDRLVGVHEDAVYDTMAEEDAGVEDTFGTRVARANVDPVRQRTQFTCMSTSMMMCLRANGTDCTEDEVNRVMGAKPMKGARWEEALACAQHYGMRATLTVPATVLQLKAWTDRGVPVMIAWNPEGREWSHASVVFDVTDGPDGRLVHVADPNIPNPEKTVRTVPEDEFYGKWFEKWPDYLVRRPALAIEREITKDGRQVMASLRKRAYEIHVDQRGMARDDEGHEWFVGREFGPKTYSGQEGAFLAQMGPKDTAYRAPAPLKDRFPVSPSDQVLLRKLPMALWADPKNDPRTVKFVGENYLKTELTEKQWRWMESLLRKYRRVIDRMPDKLIVTYKGPGIPWYVYISGPKVESWVRDHFETQPRGPDQLEIRGPKKPGAAPTQRSTFGPEQVSALESLLARRPGDRFIGSILDQVRRGRPLSDKQLSAIRRNFYQARMRDMADLFRAPKMAHTSAYKGNPNRKPIYPHEIDHGYDEPLAGGTDVMKRLQNKLLYEQGMPQRPENPKVGFSDWQNLLEVAVPDGGAPAGLIEPYRRPEAVDPEAADAFWFTEKEPAVVWRNYHFPNRSVMQAPDEASYFTLVPADEIGKWGGAAWQLVSPPNNPRTAMDPMNELKKLSASEPLTALEEFAGCAKGDTSCDPTENMSPEDKKKWEDMNKKHRNVVKNKHKGSEDPLSRLERVAVGDNDVDARFEEGKPADPCENMSEAECKEWKANTEKHKDKFKKEGASRNQVKRWMVQNYQDYVDRRTGEVNMTDLAENAAWKFDPSDTWLDDETHWVWDLAEEIADKVQRGRLASCDTLNTLERFAAEDDEKDARWEEGSHPSDEEITKNMSPAEKEKWLKHKGEVGKKAFEENDALQAVWAAWDALEGTEKVKERESFLKASGSLALSTNLYDELYDTPYDKYADTLEKRVKSIERQSRSWRTAYNLGREGRIDIDYGRMAKDLKRTLKSVRDASDLVDRIGGLKREYPEIWNDLDWEWERAHSAAERAVRQFEQAATATDRHGKKASADPLAELQRIAAKKPMVRDLKRFMDQNDIEGEVTGRGANWEVEVPNQAAHAMFEQAFGRYFPGVSYGGYRAGYGGWVLSPDYHPKGDWGDPGSPHHYAGSKEAQFEETVDLYVGVDDLNQEMVGPATDNPDAASKRWWRRYSRGIDLSVYKLQDVPLDAAEAFTDFGTRAPQMFRDGRAAWQAAKKYRPRGIAAAEKTARSIQFEVLLRRINLKNPDTLPYEYKLNSKEVQDVTFGGLFGGGSDAEFEFMENIKGEFGDLTLLHPKTLSGPGVVEQISSLGVSDYDFPGRWSGLATVVVDDMMMTVPFKMKLSRATSNAFGEITSGAGRRASEDKTARAPSGLYGFTKRTQNDVEASIRKLQRKAALIAKRAYTQDEGVAPFLSLHAKRGRSASAKMLVAAMKTLGPKIASEDEEAVKTARGVEVPLRWVQGELYWKAKPGAQRDYVDAGREFWPAVRAHGAQGLVYVDGKVRWPDGFEMAAPPGLVRQLSDKRNYRLAAFSMGKKDKQVIDAFLDKKPLESKKLMSDGKRLDGSWMGGSGIAKWVSGKIEMPDLGSKAADTVQRAIKKKAPKNWLKEGSDKEGVELDGDQMRIGGAMNRYRNIVRKLLREMGRVPVSEAVQVAVSEGVPRHMALGIVKDVYTETSRGASKEASYGLYGYRAKTASLGLMACMQVKEAAGAIAADLHRRRMDRHAKIVGFLDAHRRQGRCMYARMLHRYYPDETMKLASGKAASEPPRTVAEWLAHEV